MEPPLLSTKLFTPPTGPNPVWRQRLIEQLNAGLGCKLTLVSAPARFGKSTLVSTLQFPEAVGLHSSASSQKLFYGIAVADIFLACPIIIIGIVLVFVSPRLGFYLLAWVSFWFVWANIMTTVTSLRFEKPKITLNRLIVFPFGALVGLAYFVWTLAHFEAVYLP